jgi:regulator of sigma E protease
MFDAIRSFFEWAPLGLPAFLFVITMVVFFHELGHFLVARACGVKVEVFSICFGREIVGWTDKHGTRWKIGWLPLGGFVKFLGDANAASMPDQTQTESLSPEDQKRAFPLKPLHQRAMIVAAGPVANFILAIAIFFVTFMLLGRQVIAPRIDTVTPNSPAAQAGLKKGDLIRSVDGEKISGFGDMQRIVALGGGDPISITVERDGKPITVSATPRSTEVRDPTGAKARVMMLGITNAFRQGDVRVEKLGPVQAMGAAVDQTWLLVRGTFSYARQMIRGRSDTSQMMGPVGIARVSRQMASVGFLSLVNLAALISVSLGLVNLFPIPLLDGGHLLYYGCEAVLGRPLGPRAQDVGFRLGLALVLGLMILATWNDVVRLDLF